MDSYLESLVDKSEQDKRDVPKETAVDVVDSDTDTNTVSEEPDVATTEVPEEDTIEKVAETEEASIEENKIEDQPESNTKEIEKAKEDTSFVQSIRIYNVPDIHSPSFPYTGMIEVIDQMEDGYKKIQYMKHGLGLVTGYIHEIK